jgi:hypothetical protein
MSDGRERTAREPRRRRSWLVKGYGVFGVAVIAAYLWQGCSGWEPTRSQRGIVPASVRASPGGYRSFHFWHGGFHGGK